MLHQLGEERLAASSDSVLVTRRADGALVIAAWNLAPPAAAGTAKEVNFQLQNTRASRIQVTRLDPEHGDVHKAYEQMGSPRYPTRDQIEKLRTASRLAAPEVHEVKNGLVTLSIPSHGLVLLEVKNSH
jgi:xylan 1,4-beta-xylosidase